ncbi:unnamed protein product [[Candida] boidinii]|uniref:Unnamed protein product n=1 Tax=Candida boidinii TaxID=5477 RepID=A0ACB5TP26_CANBO|nr:unnamed protein product [[Candida] boidinii]
MEQELIDSENNDNFYKNNNIKDDEFKYNDLKFISSNPMFINEIRILNRIDKFYENSLSSLNSIIKVFIQLLSSNIFTSNTIKFSKDYELKLKNNNYKRDISNYDKEKLELIKLKESTLRSISNIIFYLLKWFKRSNIMKFEYFSSLLYDNDFYFKYIKFLNCNQINVEFINSLDLTDTEILMKNRVINCEYKILDNYKEYNFFKMAMEYSTIHNKFKYKINEKDKKLVKIIEYENETYEYFMPPFNGQSKYNIKNPNWRYCSILITLFKVLYMTLYKTKTQRIYKLLETRPTEVFRFYLSNFNEEMYRPILKIVKLISPFSGKKWRSNNMDLISLVYLFYRVGLNDSWLTNYFSNNLSERIKKSWECEYSLRSLIQFYNMINYKDAMKSMGYELTNDYSFFGPELERLITEEMNEMSTDTTYD